VEGWKIQYRDSDIEIVMDASGMRIVICKSAYMIASVINLKWKVILSNMFDKIADLPIDTVPVSLEEQHIVNGMFVHQHVPLLSNLVKALITYASLFAIVTLIYSLPDVLISTSIPSRFLVSFKAFVCCILFYIITMILGRL
jgi:hypothetical protein